MTCSTSIPGPFAMAGILVLLLAAQGSAQCPGNVPRVGDIGITRIECDCDIARPDSGDEWTFRTEPTVTQIAAGSAADGRLEVGDRIVSVNGAAITTRAGAGALARLHPSQPVALAVRRRDGIHNFLLAPTAVCANSATLLGMAPATQRVNVTSARTAQATPLQRGTPAAQPSDAVSIRGTPASTSTNIATAGVRVPVTGTPGWIGIAFSCRDCGVVVEQGAARWSFTTPPEVYSVETGSPAHGAGIRRGDILTHVDSHAITSAEGGRRWASLEPGETVRVRYRRGTGDAVRTATFRTGQPRGAVTYVPAQAVAASELRALDASLATRDSATTRLLRHYEDTLRRQRTEQARMLSELQKHLSSTNERERREAETRLHNYLRQQERLHAEQQNLLRETARLRAVEAEQAAVTRRAVGEILTRVAPTGRLSIQPRAGEQRLRYSGTVRNTEVEVRGVNPVVVTERGNELIITTQDGTIVIRVRE